MALQSMDVRYVRMYCTVPRTNARVSTEYGNVPRCAGKAGYKSHRVPRQTAPPKSQNTEIPNTKIKKKTTKPAHTDPDPNERY